MYLECYEFSTDRINSIYRFSSSGDNQTIEMMVHFQLIGVTKSRNRLFRIIIALYFELIQNEFKIYGANNDRWEKFSPNRAYDSFYFQRIH